MMTHSTGHKTTYSVSKTITHSLDLVIFEGSGNHSTRKLLAALFHRQRCQLPDITNRIVATGRPTSTPMAFVPRHRVNYWNSQPMNNSAYPRVVADIGGTNARFGLATSADSPPCQVQKLACEHYKDESGNMFKKTAFRQKNR